jgi:hypothetical protein
MLGSFCKLRVWQLLSLHQFQKRVAEKKLIIPVVKAMLQFIQIGVQMRKSAWALIDKVVPELVEEDPEFQRLQDSLKPKTP